MSGSRMVTVAPLRLATGHTLSVSPTGAGSPLGWWVAPGGGWVNILGLIPAIQWSSGQPSSAMPYSEPEAAWSTALMGLARSTASTIGACSAGAARLASGIPATAPVIMIIIPATPVSRRILPPAGNLGNRFPQAR
jgi:hypothetical protein